MADEAMQLGSLSAGDGVAMGTQEQREQLAEGEEKDGVAAPPLVDDKPGTGWRAMAKRIVAINEKAFRRECLVRMLREVCSPDSVTALECPRDPPADGWEDEGSQKVDVFIVDIGWMRLPDERVAADVRFLQDRFGGVPIILLSDREDSAHVAEALGYGVRGLIPTTLGSGAVAEAVRLVAAGGTFVPAKALVHALSARQGGTGCSPPSGGERAVGLTPREFEVLTLLREGKPNKIIAATLNLQESTVKIHVSHIMKKLKARNRTETALIAQKLL